MHRCGQPLVNQGWAWRSFAPVAPGTMLSSHLGERSTAHQVHRSDRRDGTHQTLRTLPAVWHSTAMQTVRSASCLST
eukprot:7187874-Prymnesium_polylepis.1